MLVKVLKPGLGLAIALTFASAAHAGRIVVNNDEWTLSNTGFAQAGAANVTTFVANLASFMNINGGGCSFLVYSAPGGLAFGQSNFQAAMTAAGCGLTPFTNTFAFDAGPNKLANFDGVFLALPPDDYNPAGARDVHQQWRQRLHRIGDRSGCALRGRALEYCPSTSSVLTWTNRGTTAAAETTPFSRLIRLRWA